MIIFFCRLLRLQKNRGFFLRAMDKSRDRRKSDTWSAPKLGPFLYAVDSETLFEYTGDDSMFEYPYQEIEFLIRKWREEYKDLWSRDRHHARNTYRKDYMDICVVRGCFSNISRDACYDGDVCHKMCYDHARSNTSNITRIYKNAEQSLRRIMDGLARSSPVPGGFSKLTAWMSEERLEELKKSKNYLSIEDYVSAMARSQPSLDLTIDKTLFVRSLISPHIIVMARKVYFYRSINALLFRQQNDGHQHEIDTYAHYAGPIHYMPIELALKRDDVGRERTAKRKSNAVSTSDTSSDDEKARREKENRKKKKKREKEQEKERERKKERKKGYLSYLLVDYCSQCVDKEARYKDVDTKRKFCSYSCRETSLL